MASFFSRLFKFGQSEVHSVIDQLEDPIKMTEQGIRDLKKSLHEAMASLAQVKSIAIRLKRDSEEQKRIAGEYERKARLLLQKMQSGSLDQAEAEELARNALAKKDDAMGRAKKLSSDHSSQEAAATNLQAKVEKLRRDINKYENELVTLRARARTAESMKKVNRQLAGVDTSSTLSMLEKMKAKVEEEESLAQAYGELAEGESTIDEQIEEALALPEEAAGADSLAELKAKMGIE
ncbi:MAG: PspA/IM30 family protein [Acidobacteriota bacterium]